MAQLRDHVNCLTEETSSVDKESLVRQAATKGTITLLSREFGRGTDFVCYDAELDNDGGPHVIQTFVSETISEETQIKGRTARQGGNGSFSMILLDQELEKFGIDQGVINRMRMENKSYEIIAQYRAKYFDRQYPTNMMHVKTIISDHREGEKYLADLWNNRVPEVKKFIENQNRCPFDSESGSPNSRTIVLMDGTGSMQGLMEKAKQTVGRMFDRAQRILQDHKVQATFEIQFVIYRNYDCECTDILQVSSWESRPKNLRKFMASTSAYGGTWYAEAIEVALQHANREIAAHAKNNSRVTQVVLIGDAPPNSLEQVALGREMRGEKYWESTNYKEKTSFWQEKDYLVDQHVPVHTLYMRMAAKKPFEELAAATGGQCEPLDIDADGGGEHLTHLITTKVLQGVGGETLADAYRNMFDKGYSNQ